MKHIRKDQAHLNPEGYILQQERYFKYRSKPENVDRSRENQRKRRRVNPEKIRQINRVCERRRKLRKYGLTEQSYKDLFEFQCKCCAICNNKLPGGKRDWHVDHCHKTGKVRGILCHHCNLMLGNARDTPEILQRGIKYLCLDAIL